MASKRNRTQPLDVLDHITDLRGRLKAIETSRRIGYTSFDDGLLVIKGSIPEIRFTPDNQPGTPSPVSLASIFAFHYNSDLNSSIQIDVERVDSGGAFHQNGGKLQLYGEAAILSYFPEFFGLPECYLWLGSQGVESIGLQGLFNVGQLSGADALLPGAWKTGAGFSSYAYSYFATFNSTAVPIVTLHNTSGGAIAWCVTAFSNSGFTVAWATGTTDKTLLFVVLRTDA